MSEEFGNEQILDDGMHVDRVINNERSEGIKIKATFYVMWFVIVSSFSLLAFFFQTGLTAFGSLAIIVFTVVFPLVLACIVELFRRGKREKKEIGGTAKTLRNPFWFEILESGFSIFLLQVVVLIVISVIIKLLGNGS